MSKFVCKICGKYYEDHHNREITNCCGKKCRVKYQNLYGKNGLPQRDQNEYLLCYTCLEYKHEDDFNRLANKTPSPESRNRKNTICKVCFSKRGKKYKEGLKGTLEGVLYMRLSSARSSCGKRHIHFDANLKLEDLMEIYNKQKGRCNISGELLEIGGPKRPHTLSLDRINSLEGYTKDNLQLVCWAVNQMKNNLSEDQLKFWCNKIIDNV